MMNFRYRIQIIAANTPALPTRSPLILRTAIPLDNVMRATTESNTGAATMSAMKIVRRAQSISPSDKSNIRSVDAPKDGFIA